MEKAKNELYAGGETVPETGSYFDAGSGDGVHSRLRRFETGEAFPKIREGYFWKFLGTDEDLERTLSKRGHAS